jgi:hypothetical protein
MALTLRVQHSQEQNARAILVSATVQGRKIHNSDRWQTANPPLSRVQVLMLVVIKMHNTLERQTMSIEMR